MGIRMITVDRINDPIDIYAKDDARFYFSLIGNEGVHNIGSCLAVEKQGTNSIAIKDGVVSVMGRYAIIDPSDDEILTLEMNQTGYNRNDLVVAEFNSNGGDESISLKILKGTATTGTAADPVLTMNDLTQGGTIRQVALHRIKWNGTSIETIERYAPVLPNLDTLVEKQTNCIELTENTDLKEFFKTASDYTSYRANAQVAINNGIPNRNMSYPVYYVKMRDFVLAYGLDNIRAVHNLYVASFHNQTLGSFYKLWDSQLISNSLSITSEGYALDARQGKVLDDKINAVSENVATYDEKLEEIDDCVKYDSNISGNTITSNPLTFMQDESTHNYAWYNSDGLSGTGCLPDSGKCYYYKVGNMIFGYCLALHKYYFSDVNSDVWYECVTANASSKSVTLQGVLLAEGSNSTSGTAILKITREGSTIYNELRAMADGSLKFIKNSEGSVAVEQALFGANGALTIPGKLESNGATFNGSVSGTSANFSGTLKGGSVSSSGDVVASSALQGKVVQVSFDASTSGNTFFKVTVGGNDVFRILRDSSGVIRFATQNGSTDNYPLHLHQDGLVEATSDLQVDGDLLTGVIKNDNNIQIKYSGGADVTLSKSSSTTAGYLRPSSTSHESNLGSSSYKWNTVYATNTSIQSDRKSKREIEAIEHALEFVMSLAPVQYKFKNSTTATGRTHYGFIAQDVAQIAKDLNMNLSLARASHVTLNEENGTYEDNYYDGSIDVPDDQLEWSLDYNEFIAPLVAVVQEQQNEIIELRNRVARLEEAINVLLKQEV